jgi:hypothetical protein
VRLFDTTAVEQVRERRRADLEQARAKLEQGADPYALVAELLG